MGVLRMAWRNIWRNRRRTLVTIAAMTLALFVMVLYTGLMQGMLVDMERTVLEVELGDLQVHSSDYLDSPSLYSVLEDEVTLLAQLEGGGYRAAPRLLGGGLVATGESSAGASLRGIDIDLDATVSLIHASVADGEWLDPEDVSGVVVGRRLARTLGLAVGDELVALGQASDGSIANDLFYVRGILKSVGDATDRSGVFLNASTFRDFFELREGIHQILIRRPAGRTLMAAAEELHAWFPQLDVKTWRQLVPTLATMMDSAGVAIQMFSVIVYIAIGILILNATLMAVFERIREFGILKALGVAPGKVLSLILAESALQTLVALVVGLTLSAPALWYLSSVGIDTGPLAGTALMGVAFSAVIYAIVTPGTYAGPVLVLVAIVLLAVLYPAVKAARISPVEAMRFN